MQKRQSTVRNWDVMLMRQRAIIRDPDYIVPDERDELSRARICVYCRERSEKQLVTDHIEPLSRGGLHSVENTIDCCRKCNASKANLFLLEWVISGRSPVGPPREPAQPPQPGGACFPVRAVVRIERGVEVLKCGHDRQPVVSPSQGSDIGKKQNRRCYACPPGDRERLDRYIRASELRNRR